MLINRIKLFTFLLLIFIFSVSFVLGISILFNYENVVLAQSNEENIYERDFTNDSVKPLFL